MGEERERLGRGDREWCQDGSSALYVLWPADLTEGRAQVLTRVMESGWNTDESLLTCPLLTYCVAQLLGLGTEDPWTRFLRIPARTWDKAHRVTSKCWLSAPGNSRHVRFTKPLQLGSEQRSETASSRCWAVAWPEEGRRFLVTYKVSPPLSFTLFSQSFQQLIEHILPCLSRNGRWAKQRNYSVNTLSCYLLKETERNQR